MSSDLSRTDMLAIERTRLANERTFLAYFRTFIVFLSSGFAILRIAKLEEIREVGYVLVVIAPILLLIGVLRFFFMKRRLKKYYNGEAVGVKPRRRKAAKKSVGD